MKKAVCVVLSVCLSVCMALSLTSCSGGKSTHSWQTGKAAKLTGVTINVYNWGEYIDDKDYCVNDAFTYKTGIKVNYKTFTDNESMYALLSSGAADYDVIFPSDYMVGKMIKEKMIAKIDFSKVPNFQYIDSSLKNPVYDPDNAYSVPYMWGTVGIFYNTKYVDKADLAEGWGLLWNSKYKGKIFMFDNPRDAFGIALNKLGYSMNSTDPKQWQAAYEELAKQKPLLQQYVMDQVYDKMIDEEGWIAPYYSGDGIIMMDKDQGNPDIDFFIPDTGTNRFVDAMCIPVNSAHKTEAEAYINFLCSTEVAKANAEYIGYSTPQTEARKQLDPSVGENEDFYPPQKVLDKTETFITLPDSISKLEDSLWIKLKQD